MSIVFEAPQPFDAQTAQIVGQQAQQERDRKAALEQFDAMSRAQAQADASQSRRDEISQRGYEFAASQQPSNRDLFLADEQMQAAQRHFDQQKWLQQDRQQWEFSQADKLELQRLNQSRAGWDAMHNSGQIGFDEYVDGLRQLAQKRDPLLARQQATQQRNQQEMVNLHQQQAARQATMDRMNQEFMARGGPFIHTTPDGTRYFQHRPGEWTQEQRERPQPPERPVLTAQDRVRIAQAVDRHMDNEFRAMQQVGQKPPWASSPETRAAHRLQLIHNEENRLMGGPGGDGNQGQMNRDQFLQAANALFGGLMQAPGIVPPPGVRPPEQDVIPSP